jgi:small subunit ribosomal protein S24e
VIQFRLFRVSQIIDVYHPNRANVPKSELKEQIAKMFKVNDTKTIFVFGFRTVFGGAKTTGFALIYDNVEQALKFEPKYRLIRVRSISRLSLCRASINLVIVNIMLLKLVVDSFVFCFVFFYRYRTATSSARKPLAARARSSRIVRRRFAARKRRTSVPPARRRASKRVLFFAVLLSCCNNLQTNINMACVLFFSIESICFLITTTATASIWSLGVLHR